MRILLALVLLMAATCASAKCAMQLLVVSGVVVDDKGEPLPNAMVGVSWVSHSRPEGPAMALSDQQGRYRIPVWFYTDSGKWNLFGDTCNASLDEISVTAQTGTMSAMATLVSVGNPREVTAPMLKIEFPIKHEPIW